MRDLAVVRPIPHGPTPEAQEARIQRWAEAQGFRMTSWIRGEAALTLLLDQVEAGDVQRLVVADWMVLGDRLEHLLATYRGLADQGVELVVTGAGEDPLLDLLTTAARLEWLGLCALLREGIAYRKRAAERGAGTKHYGLRPGERLVIEHIRALDRAGESQTAIAQRLNEDGVPPRKGGPWCRKIVGKLLHRSPVGAAQGPR